MRSLSDSMKRKLASRIQAGDAGLSTHLWVSRPNTPLTEEVFLESQLVLSAEDITKTSMAVCHPRAMREATDIYLCYIESGVAKIVKAVHNHRMSQHVWSDVGFEEEADDVAICFDGTMPKTVSETVELVTEESPWIFWIHGGTLYAQKLGSKEKTVLAEANCRAVSAARAVWSDVSVFNYGLVVFFILGGYLYYRQLIDGQWFDAERVNFGPSGVLWQDVSAFRTWDYRVGVQLVSQSGMIYELFTQFMGIGTHSAEHFEMRDAKSAGTITGLEYHTFKHGGEHLMIENMYDAALYGGCYELGPIEAVKAWNSDNGAGDWGRYLNVSFTKEINLHQVREQESCFVVKDSVGNVFYPTRIFADYTGRVLTFDFMSFNNAVGDITVSYTPGTVSSMCDELLPGFSFTITPLNLIPVEGLPEVVSAWNSDGEGAEIKDGMYVNIQFDQPLYGELSDNFEKFTVFTEQHVYAAYPEGTLIPVEVPFVDMYWHPTEANTIQFKFGSGNANSLQKCAGNIIVEYRGGTLYGDKGPLLSFSEVFTPEGIAYRGDASDGEHITIARAAVTANLVQIRYSSYKVGGEHFNMVGASCSGVLTAIDDI